MTTSETLIIVVIVGGLALFGLVGLIAARSHHKNLKKIAQNGPFAAATVTDVFLEDRDETSSWTVRCAVETDVPEPRIWEGSIEVKNQQGLASRVPLGTMVAVAYMPRYPKVLYVTDNPSALETVERIRALHGTAYPHQSEVQARGVDRDAVIRRLDPTGVSRHHHSEFHVTVTLTAPDARQQDLTRTMFLPSDISRAIGLGSRVTVRWIPGTEKFFIHNRVLPVHPRMRAENPRP